ncbi:MAG TPA: phosphatase PAP2 family protein [Bryobacteraceae bacterium]|nr:phosphatase PAP2 family protein [Bryobacteraceae bacterium]HOQ44688.1 phosphatase PAP2 family protein [Bryobacteraceae bacterium]HPQ15992.1 phosphatase PAP2 family protein [Bryobacteraceae bacterium]HPU71898.1 phosphatase PAP2 family protein [Bryobacteraceae bacterium]
MKVQKSHLPWLLPAIGATVAMSQFDHRVAGALPNSSTQVNVGRAVSHAGTYYALGGLTASFLLAGKLGGNRRATETGLLSAAALLHTESVVQMSKWAFGRERPDYGAGKGNFFSGQQSFPSGHAAGTWAVAAIISREYYDNKWIRYGIYALPVTVSASRIAARRHFASDVIAGAVIGNLIGAFIYRRHHDPSLGGAPIRERSRAIPTPGITFSPSTRTYALSLTWNP